MFLLNISICEALERDIINTKKGELFSVKLFAVSEGGGGVSKPFRQGEMVLIMGMGMRADFLYREQ